MTRGAKLYDLIYIIHIIYHGILFGCKNLAQVENVSVGNFQDRCAKERPKQVGFQDYIFTATHDSRTPKIMPIYNRHLLWFHIFNQNKSLARAFLIWPYCTTDMFASFDIWVAVPYNISTSTWYSYDCRYHYKDFIMSAMTSQITNPTIVYSTVYSRRSSKKKSKLRVTGICEGNSPVTSEFPAQRATRKIFPFYDVIMILPGHMAR